jgi:hypothetical protein
LEVRPSAEVALAEWGTGTVVKQVGLDRLESLPGIGPFIAEDLRRIGVREPTQLHDERPEDPYERLQAIDGPADRCVLHTFRAAHHFVTQNGRVDDATLLLWWNWMDPPPA